MENSFKAVSKKEVYGGWFCFSLLIVMKWLKNSWEGIREVSLMLWRRKAVSWHFSHGELGPRMAGNTHWTKQSSSCSVTSPITDTFFSKFERDVAEITPFCLEIHLNPRLSVGFLQPLNSVNLCCGKCTFVLKHVSRWAGRRNEGHFKTAWR